VDEFLVCIQPKKSRKGSATVKIKKTDLFVEVGEHAFEKLVQLAMRAVELARLLT
jgi:hypothetical protein